MTAPSVFGQASPQVEGSDYNTTVFLIQQGLLKVQTMTLVRVLACTNAGGVSPSGTVDVQPLVNQMTGNRQSIPHKPLYKMPYARIQGGTNAIIMDPQVGDIGLALFASRDISGVKSSRGQANPGSFRTFNYADGIYIGGVLNGIPVQYMRFTAAGILVVSPTEITLQAPTVAVTGNLTVSGTTVGTGEGTFNGIPVSTHVHPGVQSGGSDTGTPIP